MDALNFEAALGNDTAAIWVAGWLADGRAVDSLLVKPDPADDDATQVWAQQPFTPETDQAALRARLAVARHDLHTGRWNA
jgi:hypothetical protein